LLWVIHEQSRLESNNGYQAGISATKICSKGGLVRDKFLRLPVPWKGSKSLPGFGNDMVLERRTWFVAAELCNTILDEQGLRFDREPLGRPTACGHTYNWLRLIERADIYQIPKNCPTPAPLDELPRWPASEIDLLNSAHLAIHVGSAPKLDDGATPDRRLANRT
jgi:hypothetical protein